MILRELIGRLTMDMDRGAFDAADKRISGVKRGLEFAGQAAIALGAALGVGIGFAVNSAADANETLNLMGIVFGESRDRVVQWADAVGAATGRSVFALRETATTFGNLFAGSIDDIGQVTEMTTTLTQRAVDFGSAYNLALEGADGVTGKFLSALSGEVEPLRRFGINMTVAALEAFRLEQGITKSVAKMTEAEKAQLRYAFLMDKTAAIQGDAAKTSEAYANASRALRASLRDLATNIGMKFLPAAESIMRGARKVIQALSIWVEKSNIVQAALITFGAIATAIGLSVAATWIAANLPIVLAGLALAALVLIVDDFLTFLEGGDSVIGAFIDSMWGPGSAAEAAANFRAVLDDLGYFFTDLFLPAATEAWQGVKLAVSDLVGYFTGTVWPAISTVVSAIMEVWRALWAQIAEWLGINQGLFDGWAKAIKGAFGSVFDFIEQGFNAQLALFGLSGFKLGDIAAFYSDDGEATPRATQRGTGVLNADWGAWHAAADQLLRPATLPGAVDNSRQTQQTINQTVAVTVPAGTPRDMARGVGTTAAEELRRMNRHARAGLTQRAEGG